MKNCTCDSWGPDLDQESIKRNLTDYFYYCPWCGEDLGNKSTDLERFIDLYKSFKVDCIVVKEDTYQYIIFAQTTDYDRFGGEEIISDKFTGYSGFHCTIDFDLDGNFIKQSFWE